MQHEIDLTKTTQPYEYYLKFVEQNCRPDERRLSDIRPCKVTADCVSTVTGSATARLGATTVLCGVSARLAPPKDDRPDRGFVVCSVELPALCSARNSMRQASLVSGQAGSLLSQVGLLAILKISIFFFVLICSAGSLNKRQIFYKIRLLIL